MTDRSDARSGSERETLLRAGIEDAINALCHLLKQTGKPDLDDIIRRVVTNVVPRLHAALDGEGHPTTEPSAHERYEKALREIIALVPDYEESRRIADERGAEVANALTVGAWRAAEVARKALGIDDERSRMPKLETAA